MSQGAPIAIRKVEEGNPSNEETSRSGIPRSVRRWVFVPIICLTGAGMGLLNILYLLVTNTAIRSEFAWPALILVFAGIPSAFVANVKKLMDAATTATS